MEKLNTYKRFQLLLFVVLAGLGLLIIVINSGLTTLIAEDHRVRALCALLGLAYGLSFVFIFMDMKLFSSVKEDYQELNRAVTSDPLSGIANRNGCDSMIEKYLDKPLPSNIGSVMFQLDVREVNQTYGYTAGNKLIRDFSGILQSASLDYCFVGRNGGNKFLALFEQCSDANLKKFLREVQDLVNVYNGEEGNHSLDYRYGVAFNEGPEVKTITDLVALSNHRISEQ